MAYASIAVVAVALISAGIAAYGSYQQAQYQAGVMEYNAILARQQGIYAQQVGEYEASLLAAQAQGTTALGEAQAAIAEQEAKYAVSAGKIREAAIRRAYDQAQGQVRAAVGKSGVDTTGSPLMVLLENADTAGQQLAVNDYQTKLDVFGAKAGAMSSRAEASLRAQSLLGEASIKRFGAGVTAAGYQSQAAMFGAGAGNVRQAGYVNVGTTLLGGIGTAGNTYLRYGG